LKLNTLVFLNIPTDKSLRGLGSGEMGAFLKNYLQTYVDINFLPCFGVGGSHSWSFPKHFTYTQYTVHKSGCGKNNMWQMARGPQVGHLVLNNHSPPCKPDNSYHYVMHRSTGQ
jgi:hypothetical protein